MSDILEKILARKREEVQALRRRASRSALSDQGASQAPGRGFAAALERRVAAGSAGVIAEIKRASPSRGARGPVRNVIRNCVASSSSSGSASPASRQAPIIAALRCPIAPRA